MKWIAIPVAFIIASAGQAEEQSDVSVFQRALSRDAVSEMHCHGLPIEEAEQRFDSKYKNRQERIRAALSQRGILKPVEPNQDVIPIGFKCPHYRGAETRLRASLRLAERRLRG
jgi:hypothetical protein